jgi:hypothetical protein
LRIRSGKNYGDDNDMEGSKVESKSDTDEVHDVEELVIDCLTEPKLNSCLLEKTQFGLSATDLEKY